MEIERVQKWVMSALLLVVSFIFASGLCFLAGSVDRAGAKPGLLTIAGFVGVIAMGGVRIINQKRLATPWLLVGLIPTAIGVAVLYF